MTFLALLTFSLLHYVMTRWSCTRMQRVFNEATS